MSTHTRQTLRTGALLLLILAGAAIFPLLLFGQELAAASAEPLPWWKKVDEFQGLFLKWLYALSFVAGAFMVVAAQLLSKYRELRDRMDREELRKQDAVRAALLVISNDKLHEELAKNSALTERAADRADAAYHEANSLNLKIEKLGIENNQLQREQQTLAPERAVQPVEVVNRKSNPVPTTNEPE